MSSAIDTMGEAIDVLAEIGEDQKKESLLKEEGVRTQVDWGDRGDIEAKKESLMNFMGKKGEKSLLKLKSTLKDAMAAVSVLLTQKQRRSLQSFLQAPFTGDYSSQSGEIVGILKSMRDTFKENLASARSAEKAALEAHEKFMKIKEDEYNTMKTAYDEKQAKLGENDDELASLT